MAEAIYCDGGVIERNPSLIGGTWAWVLTQDDEIMRSASGVIPTANGYGGVVTNNVSELTAALEALESLPMYWQDRFYSDSQVTLGRVFLDQHLRGVPDPLVNRLRRIQIRLHGDLSRMKYQLLQGHPTRADLASGIGAKRGLPVSRWNAWCDRRCQEEAAGYVAGIKSKEEIDCGRE